MTPVPEPGINIEIDGCTETSLVPKDKLKSALDNLCHTWSEVKLCRLTNSELERYLGKVDQKGPNSQDVKGDNTEDAGNTNYTESPSHPVLSQSGRPLRCAAAKSVYMDPESDGSCSDESVVRRGNKHNLSKPSSSGPSVERIATQNKRTESPVLGIKPSKVYKHSSSPSYSISSSGSSTYHPDLSDNYSDATFEGFEPLTEKELTTLVNKSGKLKTVEYGLKKEKGSGCIFVMKGIVLMLANRFVNSMNIILKDTVWCCVKNATKASEPHHP